MMEEGRKLGIKWTEIEKDDLPVTEMPTNLWTKKTYGKGRSKHSKMVPSKESRAMHNSYWWIDKWLNWWQGQRWSREVFYKKNQGNGVDETVNLPYKLKSLREHRNENKIPKAYSDGWITVE